MKRGFVLPEKIKSPVCNANRAKYGAGDEI